MALSKDGNLTEVRLDIRLLRAPECTDQLVVKSQEEALSSGQVYDYCLLTTKCLPDITPNSHLLAPALASDQIKSYALIQNGLDVEKDIHAALQEKGTAEDVPIVTAAAWIGLMTSPDGKRISWSGPRVSLLYDSCSLV
jgi:2-dehydropantoate 2-reductase